MLRRSNTVKSPEQKKTSLIGRTLSVRSKKEGSGSSSRSHFSFSSIRGATQPALSKKLYMLIKTQNQMITAYEHAGKDRASVAEQLSEWGAGTGDDGVKEVSDKLAVIMTELGEQEESYAHHIDDSRVILKLIRDMEKSTQPTRDLVQKLQGQIGALKAKEPESAELVTLEAKLVGAEASNLVAEAQLTNATRTKMKEAFAQELSATIERAERQIILARHGRRILGLLDDTPVVPGVTRPEFDLREELRTIMANANDDMREYQYHDEEPVYMAADSMCPNLLPRQQHEDEEDGSVAAGESASTIGEHRRQMSGGSGGSGGSGNTAMNVAVPGGYEPSIGMMTEYSNEQRGAGSSYTAIGSGTTAIGSGTNNGESA